MIIEQEKSLYNHDIKIKYLNEMVASRTISIETRNNYLRIFKVASKIEFELDKDLSIFSLEEIEIILNAFQAKNRNTVESYARIISSYLKWSVKNQYTLINVLSDLRPDDFNKYLTNGEVYMTEKELWAIEGNCVNAQDAVILRLLFIGVSGKELSELKNLKRTDIDFENNRLKLINTLKSDGNGYPIKSTTRWIGINDEGRTLALIQKALNQKTYLKRNGDMEPIANIRPYTDLVMNDYVLRPSITKTEGFDTPVDKFVIYRRIEIIEKSLGLENLTAKFMQRSGMILLAKQLTNGNDPTLDDLKIIAARYNLASYHNLKGFITAENIRETYPISSTR